MNLPLMIDPHIGCRRNEILCEAGVDGDADPLRSAAPEKWAEIAPAVMN
jgi:hypothetical protein